MSVPCIAAPTPEHCSTEDAEEEEELLQKKTWVECVETDKLNSSKSQEPAGIHPEANRTPVLSNKLHKSASVPKEWKGMQNWGMQGSKGHRFDICTRQTCRNSNQQQNWNGTWTNMIYQRKFT